MGNPSARERCDVTKRIDGCSALNDAISNTYKEVFREACNAHDSCYHAPWDRISDYWSGFNKCNNNFWNDMNAKCDSLPKIEVLACKFVASIWGDAMNFDPGRTVFSDSFERDQRWMRENCDR